MDLLLNGVLVVFILVFPYFTQYARDKIKGLSFINPLIASYIMGIILGNTLLKGDRFFPLLDAMSTAAVLFSIPLMLFGLNLRSVIRSAGKAVIGMLLACVATVVTLIISYFIFARHISDFPGVAGLLIALYTGGTPNLAAIRTASGISNDLFIAVHAGDIIISAVFLLFMITGARKILMRILPKPQTLESNGGSPSGDKETAEPGNFEAASNDSFPLISDVFRRIKKRRLLGVIGIALVVAAVSAALGLLFPPDAMTIVVILSITTLSIGASFIPWIRETKGNFEIGEYAILIFALSAGGMGDFSRILSSSPVIFAQVAFAIFLSLIFHVLLCRLFRLDVDTMMISSTAAVFSPPFVGIVATAIGNKKLIAPGIAAGLIGYALGNYLGIAAVQLFRLIS